jgi:hypothetical protein
MELPAFKKNGGLFSVKGSVAYTFFPAWDEDHKQPKLILKKEEGTLNRSIIKGRRRRRE